MNRRILIWFLSSLPLVVGLASFVSRTPTAVEFGYQEEQEASRSAFREEAKNNHLMTGFRSVMCGHHSCIEVVAPKAWLSGLGGFSTGPGTVLRVLDREGHVQAAFEGESASYTDSLKVVTIDCLGGGMVLADISSEKIQNFSCVPQLQKETQL